MNALTAYINGALEELRHVRWPTRQQAIRLSIIVLVFTGASAIFLGIADFGLAELIKFMLSFV